MEPKHPVRPAFEQAREWMAYQEKLLTEQQRIRYQELKEKQEEERKKKEDALEKQNHLSKEEAKKARDRYQYNLRPPGAVYNRRAFEEQKNAAKMAAELSEIKSFHEAEKIKFLENAERERAERERQKSSEKAKDTHHARAIDRTDRSGNKDSQQAQDKTKDETRARAIDKVDQRREARERSKSNEKDGELTRTFNRTSGRSR